MLKGAVPEGGRTSLRRVTWCKPLDATSLCLDIRHSICNICAVLGALRLYSPFLFPDKAHLHTDILTSITLGL